MERFHGVTYYGEHTICFWSRGHHVGSKLRALYAGCSIPWTGGPRAIWFASPLVLPLSTPVLVSRWQIWWLFFFKTTNNSLQSANFAFLLQDTAKLKTTYQRQLHFYTTGVLWVHYNINLSSYWSCTFRHVAK